ncbi:ribosome-binding protein aMBF1 (putative translation factor) [Salinibacter ruber]|uniref:helix-turn-helix domain-containing protein n=1 Tax=Salinibacter ruber TaxID=146919 RepID=UPI002169DC7D|nr:ribosome-binding protein aMBF1 (putative translation factor) [Salinibacter ruber]
MASQPENSESEDKRLKNNTILDSENLSDLARSVRLEAGDSQEEAAAKLDVGQSQVSKAENGVRSYFSVCVRIIEEYTDCTVEYPLYRIKR